jgi:hypothetical protein
MLLLTDELETALEQLGYFAEESEEDEEAPAEEVSDEDERSEADEDEKSEK